MSTSTVRLKQLAEAATPGPWQYLEFDPHSIPEACHGVLCTDDMYIGCDVGKKDGAYIAAANPEAVLGLIARIEKLEATLKNAIGYSGNLGDDYLADKLREALKEEETP